VFDRISVEIISVLFFRWREEAYVVALLRAVDVAVRRYGPTPEPTVAAEGD
jgi:hypothetical protein